MNIRITCTSDVLFSIHKNLNRRISQLVQSLSNLFCIIRQKRLTKDHRSCVSASKKEIQTFSIEYKIPVQIQLHNRFERQQPWKRCSEEQSANNSTQLTGLSCDIKSMDELSQINITFHSVHQIQFQLGVCKQETPHLCCSQKVLSAFSFSNNTNKRLQYIQNVV